MRNTKAELMVELLEQSQWNYNDPRSSSSGFTAIYYDGFNTDGMNTTNTYGDDNNNTNMALWVS